MNDEERTEEIDRLYSALRVELDEIERVSNEAMEKRKSNLITKFNKRMVKLIKLWEKLDKQEEVIKTKATLYKLNHESSELDEQINELSQ